MKRLLPVFFILLAGLALAGTDVSTWTAFKAAVGAGQSANSQAVNMGDGAFVVINRALDRACAGDCVAADGGTLAGDTTAITGQTRLWQAGAWGACSNLCGAGSATRTVSCVNAEGLPAGGCDEAAKLPVTQGCSDASACTYAWESGTFGACDTDCGDGSQARAVLCRRSDGASADDSFCTGAKPTASQACTSTAGCGYAWHTGAYGACAAGCTDTSSQLRTVSCRRSDGTDVADASCAALGEKPGASQPCASYSTCVTPAATLAGATTTYTTATNIYTPTITGNVAACAWTFGGGMTGTGCIAQSKAWSAAGSYTVQLDMTGVNSLQTASASKAVTVWTKTVANFTAPTPLVVGIPASFANTGTGDAASCAWNFGDSGTATTCAPGHAFTGVTQRSVTLTVTGKGGDTSTKTLNVTPITSSWATGEWGACSAVATCAGASTQTRAVSCLGSDASTLTDSYCANAGVKPSTSLACTDYSSCTYAWQQNGFGACDTSCGTGQQSQTVTCRRGDGVTVADSYCTAAKPSTTQACTVTTGCSSCLAVKTAIPASGDGTYSLNMSGSQVSAYCDMTSDSGGWTRLNASIATATKSFGVGDAISGANNPDFNTCGGTNYNYKVSGIKVAFTKMRMDLTRTTTVLQCSGFYQYAHPENWNINTDATYWNGSTWVDRGASGNCQWGDNIWAHATPNESTTSAPSLPLNWRIYANADSGGTPNGFTFKSSCTSPTVNGDTGNYTTVLWVK